MGGGGQWAMRAFGHVIARTQTNKRTNKCCQVTQERSFVVCLLRGMKSGDNYRRVLPH